MSFGSDDNIDWLNDYGIEPIPFGRDDLREVIATQLRHGLPLDTDGVRAALIARLALQRIPKNSARQEFGQLQDDCVLRPRAILLLVNKEAGVAAAYDLFHCLGLKDRPRCRVARLEGDDFLRLAKWETTHGAIRSATRRWDRAEGNRRQAEPAQHLERSGEH
jgi:hypothetical protein